MENLPAPVLLERAFENKEKITREEWTPISNIMMGDMIVDGTHALELGNVMLGDWGITQPVLLRARFADKEEDKDEGEVVYDPLDGYHRIVGLGLVHPEGKEAKIKSIVMYGCTDEEMYDQRILAANSVQAVKFARQCNWINKAWSITPWKDSLTATQAFGLAANSASSSNLIKNEEELAAIRGWVEKKAQQWLSPIRTIYSNLNTFDLADPQLVNKVRTGTFTKGELAITPAQLGIIVNAFPHTHFPGVQQEIARFATARGLSTEKIEMLARNIMRLKEIDAESVRRLLTSDEMRTRFQQTQEKHAVTSTEIKKLLEKTEVQIRKAKDIDNSAKAWMLIKLHDISLALPTDEHDVSIVEMKNANIFIQECEKNYNNFEDDKVKAKFTTEANKRLTPNALQIVATKLVTGIFSTDTQKRDLTLQQIALLPLQKLTNNHITQLFNSIGEEMKQAFSTTYEPVEVDGIVDSLMALLNKTDYLSVIAPYAWDQIVSDVLDLSKYGTSSTQQTYIDWYRDQNSLNRQLPFKN